MSADDGNEPFRITAEDLEKVEIQRSSAAIEVKTEGVAKSYGTIMADTADSVIHAERGSILLQGWFYLGVAGLIASVLGWAICEPAFVDGGGNRWGNTWMVPGIIIMMCVAFGVAESVVERSARKALMKVALALPLGLVLGFVFSTIANVIYRIGLQVCYQLGAESVRNPLVWIARGIGWAVFGAASGIIYGVVGQSMKKARYGILGGLIGATIGGVLFDPISFLTNSGAPSRLVGFALVSTATGIAMGLVESMLKDRWLYVTQGPLAGKQFILYRLRTTIGSDQRSDIYLFKDPSILPKHAELEIQGSRILLRATGLVFAAGNPVQSHVLRDNELLQVGRYAFRYREKHRQ